MRKLSVMLLLVACGDDGARHTPDASPRDGAPDSPADAPLPNPVTLTATQDGQPVAGVHVYFQNADSSVVLATTTDAQGTASAVMAAGGYVTAVDPFTPPAFRVGPSDELDTFVGVKPGDHLLLKASFAASTKTVTVQAPNDLNMLNFTAYTPCNYNPGAPLSVPPQSLVSAPAQGSATLTNCGATTDFLVFATNGSASEFLYAADQAVADQGTVDLTAGTYTAATGRTITFTNIPALRSVALQDDLIGPRGPMYEMGGETPSDTPAPTVSLIVPLFTGAIDVLQIFLQPRSFSQQTLVEWGALGSATTIDVGARTLYDFAGVPAFDPATKTASVAMDTTTGQAPDFSLFAIFASRQAAGRSWHWYVTAPDAGSVMLPTVPTDIFDFNIAAGDSFNVESWVTGKVPGGYDAVRAFVLAVRPYLYGNSVSPQDLVFGGSGAASFVQSVRPLTLTRRVPAIPRVLGHRTR